MLSELDTQRCEIWDGSHAFVLSGVSVKCTATTMGGH
jgi:hypothetical protein